VHSLGKKVEKSIIYAYVSRNLPKNNKLNPTKLEGKILKVKSRIVTMENNYNKET
jgi:hypothetical protein